MPKGSASFTATDMNRAILTARRAGLPILRTEVGRDGRIVLVHAETATPCSPAKETGANEWDEYLAAPEEE